MQSKKQPPVNVSLERDGVIYENIEDAPPIWEVTAEKQRQNAYRDTADPLFFKWQRGEATKEEWLAAIETIKEQYPHE